MKKYIIISLFAFTAILIIFSCRKAIDPEPKEHPLMTPASLTEQKIMNFLNRIDQPLKDEKLYSTDSAIWYSTAGLNFTYAIYDSAFVTLSKDTSHFSMALDENDQVLESELDAVFEDMEDSLEVHFDALQDNIKHVIYCMVFEEGLYEGRLDVGMVSVMGCGYSGNYYASFGATDYWYSVLDYGKCDQYAPAYYNVRDAGEEIEYKILHPLVDHNPDYRVYTIPGSEVFFEDIDPREYNYANAPRGYRAFYYLGSGSWTGPQCCDPDELNFYLTSNGIDYIIDDYQPQDLDFIWIDIDGELYLNYPSYEEIHLIDLTFGETYETVVQASQL